MYQSRVGITNITTFKPGVRGQRLCAPGFLKLLWSTCQYACVCVCVSAPRALITSGVIWCDIDRA